MARAVVHCAVCEVLEQRKLLSALWGTSDAAELLAITSSGSAVRLEERYQGPLPFPFENGTPKEELLQADGKRLVAGYVNGNWALARFNTDGMLDASFGWSGKMTTDFGTPSDEAFSINLRPDGDIVMMGLIGASSADYHFAVTKYDSDGWLDTSFADSGKLLTNLGRAPSYGVVGVVLADGRIHVTGWDGNKSVAMEYDASGREGFDRLMALSGVISPSASTRYIGPPQRGTLAYYAGNPLIGPAGALSNDLVPAELHTVEAGGTVTFTLSGGLGRYIDWGDGNTLAIANGDSGTRTHPYVNAGTYKLSLQGWWNPLQSSISFSGAGKVARTVGLSIASGGQVDLNQDDLVVQYSGSSPFSTIRQWVQDGFRASPDSSATGITSTFSQNHGGAAILALFDNAAFGSSDWPPGSGSTIDANSVVGRFTWFGDVSFDGQVTGDDYAIIDANLGAAPADQVAWLMGDANIDGLVTGDDYAVIDANLGVIPTLNADGGEEPLKADDVLVTGPAAPSDLVAIEIGTTTVKLRWVDYSATEDEWHVYASTDGGRTFGPIPVAIATSPGSNVQAYADVTGLTPETDYVFRLVAVKGTAESGAQKVSVRTAREVTVQNFGFEADVLGDGQTKDPIFSWTAFPEINDGAYAENPSGYNPPEGSNVAHLLAGEGNETAIFEVLSETVRVDALYTLTAKVKEGFEFSPSKVELRAGGSTLVGTVFSDTVSNGFRTIRVTYASDANSNHLGQSLEVWLSVSRSGDTPGISELVVDGG